MHELRFDYHDIFKAPRLGWSRRKMYVSFRGILIAWGLYFVFAYIALYFTPLRKEIGVVDLFRDFEFFPTILSAEPGIAALLIFAFGKLLAVCVLLVTAASIAKITFEDLRGNDVYGIKEALQFGRSNASAVIASMLLIGVLVFIFVISFIFWGLIGCIPSVGSLFVAVMSIPLFFWGLLGIAVLWVFICGFCLVPAITACGASDILEIIIQTFSSVLGKPMRFIGYEILSKIVVFVSSFVLGSVSFLTVRFINGIMCYFMGNTLCEMITIAWYRLPFVMDSQEMIQILFRLGDIVGTGYFVDTTMVSGMIHVAGWLYGIMHLLIITWIFSYVFSSFFSSQVLILLSLRKQRDGKDLRTNDQII